MEHIKIAFTYTIKYIFMLCTGMGLMGLPIDLFTYFTCVDCEAGWQNFELTFTLIRVGFYCALFFGIIHGIMSVAMMPRGQIPSLTIRGNDMKMTDIQKLLSKFSNAAIRHHEYSLSNSAAANRAAREMAIAYRELTKLGPQAREKLLELIESDDPRISINAACYSLKFNPEKSLAALETLKKQPGTIGFEAEQAIMRWEEGNWNVG
jgi:hypothetical protein